MSKTDWEAKFDAEYGTTSINLMAVGIVAQSIYHAQTEPADADASHITKKLKQIIERIEREAYRNGVEDARAMRLVKSIDEYGNTTIHEMGQ